MFAEATSPAGALVSFSVPATPAGAGAVTCRANGQVIASPAQFPLGTTAVECTRADRKGRAQKVSFPVIVRDTSAPVLALPADISLTTASPAGVAVTFTATASDLVSGAVDTVCVPPSGSQFRIGTTTVVCSARDARGNRSTGSFRVVLTLRSADSTPPVVTVPRGVTVEATSAAGAPATFAASALDAVDGARPTTCAPASGSLFPLGDTVVVCSASDSAGNLGTASFTVHVVDNTAPVVTAPVAPAPVEASGPDGAVVGFGAATATDAVSSGLTVVCTPVAGSTFPVGTTTVGCTATDAAGNNGSATFPVVVRDTTAPTFFPVADVVVEATGPAGAPATVSIPLASDLVTANVPVLCSTPGSFASLPLGFPVGPTEIDCTATDAAGNTATTAFHVVVLDTTPPKGAAHGDLTAEATSPAGAAVTYAAPAASDLVDGTLLPACVPVSGSTFVVGDTTVTCTATDAHGNAAAGSFRVTVADTTPPSVATRADVSAEATGPAGAAVTYAAPAATDLVDGAISAVCVPASGLTFALGDATVTCTATDAHGNSACSRISASLGAL